MTAVAALPAGRRAALAWALGVGLALLVPLPAFDAAPPRLPLPLDKLVHVALFAGLARAALRALPAARRSFGAGALTMAAVVLYGGALELAQTVLGGRTGEVTDVAADALGALAGVLLAGLSRRP